MLGGSLLAHRAQHFQERESGLFDITITIELQQMHAKELSTTVERLTGVNGPKLARDRASFHISVKPAVGQTRPTTLALLPRTGCCIGDYHVDADTALDCALFAYATVVCPEQPAPKPSGSLKMLW